MTTNYIFENPETIISNLTSESRAKVCIVVKNTANKFLLLKRRPDDSYPNIWECAGGKYEQPETIDQCVFRELEEETGITEIMSIDYLFASCFKEESTSKTVYVLYYCVTTNQNVTTHPEHVEAGWFSQKEAMDLVAFDGPKKAISNILF
jgi:8-oxo-dGTP diphosphatase